MRPADGLPVSGALALLACIALAAGGGGLFCAPAAPDLPPAAPAALPALPAPPRMRRVPPNAALHEEIARLETLLAVHQVVTPAARPAAASAATTPTEEVPTLPDAPTAAQVETWLDRFQERLAGVHSLAGLEPEVAALRRFPHGHLALLLAARGETRSWDFMALTTRELPGLLGPADHDLTLAWLPRVPCLVQVVLANHWEQDAHAALLAGLAKPMPQLDQEVLWVRAVVHIGDPADQPLLGEILVRSTYGYWRRDLYAEIRDLPGLPLQQIVERAWASNGRLNGAAAFFPVAAGHGIYDALAGVVGRTTHHEPAHLSAEKALAWLMEHSDAPDDPRLLPAWLGSAADPPRFDPATRRWLRGGGGGAPKF